MAVSTCPNSQCKGHGFEIVEHEPMGGKFKVHFIQCASCGTVVGVQEYYNIGKLIEIFAKKLNVDLDL